MAAARLLFRWREALLSERGPPAMRRHVLNVLSGYGDEDGADIFPSTEALATACGMSRRRVEGHLRDAEQEGWIVRTPVGAGQGWRRMRYALAVPDVRTERPDVGAEGADGSSGPSPTDVRTERPHEPAKGADDEDTNVRTERPITSPGTSPENSSTVSSLRSETERGSIVEKSRTRDGPPESVTSGNAFARVMRLVREELHLGVDDEECRRSGSVLARDFWGRVPLENLEDGVRGIRLLVDAGRVSGVDPGRPFGLRFARSWKGPSGRLLWDEAVDYVRYHREAEVARRVDGLRRVRAR